MFLCKAQCRTMDLLITILLSQSVSFILLHCYIISVCSYVVPQVDGVTNSGILLRFDVGAFGELSRLCRDWEFLGMGPDPVGGHCSTCRYGLQSRSRNSRKIYLVFGLLIFILGAFAFGNAAKKLECSILISFYIVFMSSDCCDPCIYV